MGIRGIRKRKGPVDSHFEPVIRYPAEQIAGALQNIVTAGRVVNNTGPGEK
jgi:hypothetical protein